MGRRTARLTLQPSLAAALLLAGSIPLAVAGCASDARWPGTVPPAPTTGIDRIAEGIEADVRWLADPAREGRGLGSGALEESARYLAEGFRAAGFEPAEKDDFLQAFQVPVAIEVTESELSLAERRLHRGEDFEVLLASHSGEIAPELVFVGYGISDAESGYDDYRHARVEGRTVLVLDGRPEDVEGALGGPRGAAFTRVAYKLLNARHHGATTVILAPAVEGVPGLPALGLSGRANPTIQDAGVIALSVTRDVAEALVASAGSELGSLQSAENTVLLGDPGLRGRVRVERTEGSVANVVARLRGSDPELEAEVVVVGAHYDHLGYGEFGSLAPDRRGQVHPGADDNASGTAGLLALAREFNRAPTPRRTLVLVAFTAEEAGLLGSSRYAAAPPSGLDDTVAMINLDMIGRMRDDTVTVFGAETGEGFTDLVKRAADELELRATFQSGARGPSDQTSFATAGIPVLFFFTGTHPEYHTPDDVAERVNSQGTARVVHLAYRVARALLDADRRPEFSGALSGHGGSAPAAAPGYGPYLGTVPAFGREPVEGVRLSGVRSGSPAEAAGIKAGDVIVSFDGATVRNLEEFAALLFSARAGQRVEVVVERDGKRIETHPVLGQRR